jgi:hypothetical protein
MAARKILLSVVIALTMAMPAYAQGGGGSSGASGAGAAGTGGTATSPSATGDPSNGNPAAKEKSQARSNQIEQSEKNAAVSGSKTQPTPTASGTVSAPGVGIGHAANGKPIGAPGSGLGSPGNSAGPTR